MTKKEHKKYGQLPHNIAESDILSFGHGLSGTDGSHPFTIRKPDKTHSLLALTMIDQATGLFETVEATNKSATSIQDLYHKTWLARYLQPQFIVFDNEFMVGFKHDFKQICDNYGIKSKPTTSHSHSYTSKCNQ
jgi:hypothetical protein